MNELIKITNQDGQAVVSSREIAEHFGKNHKDVLRSIENLVAENCAAKSMFYETTFENRGKQYPMYLMNRDGFTLLAMGFTGKAALEWKLKYIEAFNGMEKVIRQIPAASSTEDWRLIRSQAMHRIAARATGINSAAIRDKRLSEAEQGRIARAMDVMAGSCKIDLDEAAAVTVEEVEAKILKESPDVVFIDHLGLMCHEKMKNQWEAVAATTHRLKALAMQHNLAIVELVQLKRRADREKPTQGDLYGGAAVEQDADAIFTLAVEEHEDFMDGDASVEMTATVQKNRHGGAGQLHFAW